MSLNRQPNDQLARWTWVAGACVSTDQEGPIPTDLANCTDRQKIYLSPSKKRRETGSRRPGTGRTLVLTICVTAELVFECCMRVHGIQPGVVLITQVSCCSLRRQRAIPIREINSENRNLYQ